MDRRHETLKRETRNRSNIVWVGEEAINEIFKTAVRYL
jgi:hypothetical protein